MARHFKKLSRAESKSLGDGNRAGWRDYVGGILPRWDETDTHLDPLFLRGYLGGYRLGAQGKRPFLMGLQ